MRSVSRHASSTKGSPTLQTSTSYINENRCVGEKNTRNISNIDFFCSTESGFGSDIFDLGAADFNRHPSAIERVRVNELDLVKLIDRIFFRLFRIELLIWMRKPMMIPCWTIEVD